MEDEVKNMAQDQAEPRDPVFEELEEFAGSDELEVLRAERDELRDKFMRALADAENARKRGERDRREAEQYGGSKLARDMLPVYDNLRRALNAVTEENRDQSAALIEGVELTLRELLSVLGRHGVAPVAPEVGDVFDPQLHQAMFEAPLPELKGNSADFEIELRGISGRNHGIHGAFYLE
ncbi:MAG: nucleotide exchange factor GrpE, partial [Gemmobacter sp.]|nr:nucleotide exchange factor GrpE [Gemmobacter sp.]